MLWQMHLLTDEDVRYTTVCLAAVCISAEIVFSLPVTRSLVTYRAGWLLGDATDYLTQHIYTLTAQHKTPSDTYFNTVTLKVLLCAATGVK